MLTAIAEKDTGGTISGPTSSSQMQRRVRRAAAGAVTSPDATATVQAPDVRMTCSQAIADDVTPWLGFDSYPRLITTCELESSFTFYT